MKQDILLVWPYQHYPQVVNPPSGSSSPFRRLQIMAKLQNSRRLASFPGLPLALSTLYQLIFGKGSTAREEGLGTRLAADHSALKNFQV